MSDDEVCVWCKSARVIPDGKGGVLWAVTSATPADCEHETIKGQE